MQPLVSLSRRFIGRNRLVKQRVTAVTVGFRQAKLVRIEPPRQWESVQRRSSHPSATRFARAKTNGP